MINEERMNILRSMLLALPFFLLPFSSANAVGVEVAWEYEKFPAKIELYDVTEENRNNISKTGSQFLSDKNPNTVFKAKWRSRFFDLKAGASKPFVLVIRNPTKQDLYFFATPHLVQPAHATLGHHFECLCNHSIFHVPAESVWYRVVRLQVWDDYKHKKMKLLHTIVGVSQEDANGKFKQRLYAE
jgi:hypothetical protein